MVVAPKDQLLRREVRTRTSLRNCRMWRTMSRTRRAAVHHQGKDLNFEPARYARVPPPAAHGVKHEPKVAYKSTTTCYSRSHRTTSSNASTPRSIMASPGVCWRDLGELSKDTTRTAKPFKWAPLDKGSLRNKPNNNEIMESEELPKGGGRDPTHGEIYKEFMGSI